jgi:endonuclease/exonuclease/phosphatase family metal-dependent hydrolase
MCWLYNQKLFSTFKTLVMPYYAGLKHGKLKIAQKKEISTRILALKDALKANKIPAKTVSETLLLATWNLREFEAPSYGERLEDAYYYIAEIISHFDIVAIQEVRRDLNGLEKLMGILGNGWNYIVSDVTEGRAGNNERMAFVYDESKVRFTNIAGELVLPPIKGKPAVEQFARTPYLVSFQSGWFKFFLCTAHAYYGEGAPGMKRRIEEISAVANFIKKRAASETAEAKKKKQTRWKSYNYILLGDFNIINREDATYEALTKGTGFTIHEGVFKNNLQGTNVKQDKYYDQIAFLKRKDILEMGEGAGVFDFFDYVFTENDFNYFKPVLDKMKADGVTKAKNMDMAYYKKWRTYQMSDHLPMWVELKIDFSREYLHEIKNL